MCVIKNNKHLRVYIRILKRNAVEYDSMHGYLLISEQRIDRSFCKPLLNGLTLNS